MSQLTLEQTLTNIITLNTTLLEIGCDRHMKPRIADDVEDGYILEIHNNIAPDAPPHVERRGTLHQIEAAAQAYLLSQLLLAMTQHGKLWQP